MEKLEKEWTSSKASILDKKKKKTMIKKEPTRYSTRVELEPVQNEEKNGCNRNNHR